MYQIVPPLDHINWYLKLCDGSMGHGSPMVTQTGQNLASMLQIIHFQLKLFSQIFCVELVDGLEIL